MKKPTQSMADMLMQSVASPSAAPTTPSPAAAPATIAPAAGEKLVAFGQRITLSHKEQLSRLAFWSRRSERLLLEQALNEFFSRQDHDLLRPIPEE